MLGEVVRKIVRAASPVYVELALLDSVLDPVESHVDGLGAALLDGVVGDTRGTRVVCLHRSCKLWVSHVLGHGSDGCCFFSVEKEGAELGFGGGGEEDFHDG